VQPHGRVGVHDAHGVRPDQAHAAVAGEPHDLLEPRAALRPAVGEAAETTTSPRTSLSEQARTTSATVRCGDGDDGEVDAVGDVAHVGVRRTPDTWAAPG
jgi:hypothetical protein